MAYDLSESNFKDVDFDKCVLIVPQGSADAYRNAKGWSRFKNIEEDSAGVDNQLQQIEVEITPQGIINNNGSKSVEIFSIEGKRIAKVLPGESATVAKHGVYLISDGISIKKIIL